jgi:hypothetical protein
VPRPEAPGTPYEAGWPQTPSFKVLARPELSTTAHNDGLGQDTAADRDPFWPGPGSSGLAGSGGAAGTAMGADQSVPFPTPTCPEPSAMTHEGPEVQVMAGSTGALTGPLAGAG